MRRDDRDDPLDDIFSEIERMMEDMTGGVGSGGAGFGGDAHVSIYESEDGVRVVADLPGARKDEIDIRCDAETVTWRPSHLMSISSFWAPGRSATTRTRSPDS